MTLSAGGLTWSLVSRLLRRQGPSRLFVLLVNSRAIAVSCETIISFMSKESEEIVLPLVKQTLFRQALRKEISVIYAY